MQEVKIKNNDLGLAVYFADKPIFSLIPDSALRLLMQDLESEIVACIEKKVARQKYRKKKGDGSDTNRPP